MQFAMQPEFGSSIHPLTDDVQYHRLAIYVHRLHVFWNMIKYLGFSSPAIRLHGNFLTAHRNDSTGLALTTLDLCGSCLLLYTPKFTIFCKKTPKPNAINSVPSKQFR